MTVNPFPKSISCSFFSNFSFFINKIHTVNINLVICRLEKKQGVSLTLGENATLTFFFAHLGQKNKRKHTGLTHTVLYYLLPYKVFMAIVLANYWLVTHPAVKSTFL